MPDTASYGNLPMIHAIEHGTPSQLDQPHKPKVKKLNGSRSIAYTEAGVGDAVLLVHGSLCDYRYWEPQLEALAAKYRVLVPSLAHYYPRLPSAGHRPFTWREHVSQLAAFLEKVAPQPVHLVGHSRGACLAYQLALQHPARVKSLTLVDPGGPLHTHKQSSADLSESVTSLRRQAVALIAAGHVEDGLRLFVDSVSRPGFWDKSSVRFKTMARDNAATLGPQIVDLLPGYTQNEAARIACPALLVDGERSPQMYRDNVEMLEQWLPDAYRVTIHGASHGMTSSHAATFNGALGDFLARW